jgi:hypothetical protein
MHSPIVQAESTVLIVTGRESFEVCVDRRAAAATSPTRELCVQTEYNSGVFNLTNAACFHAGFLLGLFFGPEGGSDMFLQDVG